MAVSASTRAERQWGPAGQEVWIGRNGRYISLSLGLTLLMLLLSGIEAVFGESGGQRMVGWVGIAFFEVMILSEAWLAMKGKRVGVRLNQEGFMEVRWRQRRRNQLRRWEEVVSFRVVSVNAMTSVVGYTLWDKSGMGRSEKTLQARYGVDGVVMRSLTMDATRLEETMNQWRRAYAKQPK